MLKINDKVWYNGGMWYVYEILSQLHRYIDGEQVQVTLSSYPPGQPYNHHNQETFVVGVSEKDIKEVHQTTFIVGGE